MVTLNPVNRSARGCPLAVLLLVFVFFAAAGGCRDRAQQAARIEKPEQGAGVTATEPVSAEPNDEHQPGAGQGAAPPAAQQPAPDDEDDAILAHALKPWTGDLDGMRERGFVRILTAYNPLFFHYNGIEQRGLAYEIARIFEEHLNGQAGRKGPPLHVVLIVVPRDELLPGLLSGRGDIAAANITITPARQELVDFANPSYTGVEELVVSGPAAGEISSFDDLAASTVHVRRSSSYFEHLAALNRQREADGKRPIPVREAEEELEDYDLLEMVEAGLLSAVIVDSHKAKLWGQVFDNIRVHEDLAVAEGRDIAWATRKDSPLLMAAINEHVKRLRKGTLLGNVLLKRYLGSTQWIDNSLSERGRQRYAETIELIRKYADRYDFDWLTIAAQAYQESKLDQSKRSHAGAIGIMQVLPTTAADPNVGIVGVEEAEPNVHAGVKYLRFVRDRYFSSPDIDPVDQVLFSFAAYNAGPANIARARKKAEEMGFDPDRWFGHVEVAASRTISREPVIYVRNIYKYYVAYTQMEEERLAREAAQGLSD